MRPLPELTPANEWFWTSGSDGVLRIQNSTALGTGSSAVSYTTTVENGAALELYPTDPLITGGNQQGLEVWYDNLVLNGTGNAAFGDAALTVPSNDNMWRGCHDPAPNFVAATASHVTRYRTLLDATQR